MIAPVTLPTPNATLAASARAPLPVLRTERLVLRTPQLDDFAIFSAILASPRAKHMGGPMDAEEAWAEFTNYTAGWLLRGDGMFTVLERDMVVGFVFAGCEPGDQDIELGFMLLEAAEGRGIAQEAALAARAYLQATGHERIVSYVDKGNDLSLTLAKRLGAKIEGVIDGTTYVCVHPTDDDGSPEAYA